MMRSLRHMCGIAALALFAAPASSQELSADRSSLSALQIFAEHCLDAAPSFESSARSIRVRDRAQTARLAHFETKLELLERSENCVCAASFFTTPRRLPNVVQNLHYVVKEEARRAWRTAKKNPTEITLDFDGTQAFVRMGYRKTSSDGVLIVSAMIERKGGCPT